MKKLLVALAAIALTGCGSVPMSTPTPTTFSVKGTLSLSRVMLYAKDGADCSGVDGFDDIHAGTQVKISDSEGKVIGLGSLGSGVARQTANGDHGTNKCVFAFEATDIPEGQGIFGVEVSHRGVVQFKRAEAEDLQLTLG